MKRHLSYFILTSLIVTSGCWSSNADADHDILPSDGEKMTVLFSNENSLQDESNFYDAILEIQQREPSISSVKIVYATDRSLVQQYEISEYPTLLVFYGGEICVRMEGAHPKREIIETLEQAYQLTDATIH
ncbi:thioredoxin domain-containing protein [Desertibacillus haloalkaliphilus]|uniref:thioredoxin domain-containing protein n=1 Tax=Desertibacillus haloalkaliphilus TaxID=1328930 RepID=UPI001C265670|nr:thioredoxin family protein [Desertibacillus haloalkaliphilus]MBU8906751.1 thioredoxin family protein [Desertibacillus haloalkaliphilus]